jgi:DNA repair protein RecO (recombination protein O)
MDLRAERLHALVLKALPYGENDLVVHLLARGLGRVPAFARGARKSQKRFGPIEPFQLCEVMLAPGKEGSLWQLRESSLVEAHEGLKGDLLRIAHAGYAAELCHDLAREGQPADALYETLEGFLSLLSRSAATSARLRALELLALEASGLSPELRSCARCGSALPAGSAVFDPGAGGLLCRRCAPSGRGLLASGPRLALLQLQQRGFNGAEHPLSADGSGRAADGPAFEQAAAASAKAMAAFLTHHIGREMKSRGFLEQVGAPA